MPYTLSNILIDLLGSLGSTETFLATGGTTTTAVNAKIAQRLGVKPVINYMNDGYLFVLQDAGGAGAAPELEYRRISTYAASSYTYTVDTAFTAAIASGDTLAITAPDFPVQEIIRAINDAVTKVIHTQNDISQVTVTDQNTYDIPVTAKLEDPIKIEIQQTVGDAESYKEYSNWEIIPGAAGSVATIKFMDSSWIVGATIRITFNGYHAKLTGSTSVIHENVNRQYILLCAKEKALEWYTSVDTSDQWKEKYNTVRYDKQEMERKGATVHLMKRREHGFFNVPGWGR